MTIRTVSTIVAWAVALVAAGAYAAPPTEVARQPERAASRPAGSAQPMQPDLQLLLSHMASDGASSPNLRLHAPARRIADFGVLVDSGSGAAARDGLHVLGASPGSPAARMGLHPGDVLVTVNGKSLEQLGTDVDGRAQAARVLKSAVDASTDAAPLQLRVRRDGRMLALSTSLTSTLVPAMRVEVGAAAATASDSSESGSVAAAACGRISTFDVAPRNRHIYYARILLLDGTTPGTYGQDTFRVSPGEHTLLVTEHIPSLQMGVGAIATTRRHTSKTLTVTVKPDTTVMVGAKLHLEKVTQLYNGAYWDPIMWREFSQTCP